MCWGFFVLFNICSVTGQAAEWQWSIAVESMVSSENQDHPRAFLWIPPQCKQVRGVVVGQHNMEEEPILEHPLFRKALSELNFAAVWITPGLDLAFNTGKGAGDHFNTMMTALAKESGYTELEVAPIVPIGHSAAASYPWNFAAWNPQRTLAAISVSGQWPFWQNPNQPDWSTRSIDGIPGIVTMGQYEAAQERAGEGLKQRQQHPRVPLSMLAEPGGGHFDVSDQKAAYLALYLKKAAEFRLPRQMPLDKPAELKSINPTKQGWLVSCWKLDSAPLAAAAPVGQYKGDPKEAFWFFDEELAVAAEQFQARYRGKKTDLLGYIQAGSVIEQNKKTHQQVTLKFLPIEDGLTFKLTGTFIDIVPEGRPESWTGLKAGSPVEHAAGGGPVTIQRICGPVQKLSDDTFAIRFDRMGMMNKKRSNEIWLLATHPGDGQYRRAVQQSVLHFPLRNNQGADQRITFPKIADQPEMAQSIPLNATSDSGAKVYYYVLAGPAEIEKDTLKFTAIPPRSKFPIKVTVVAWQWGRTIEPKLKTADPVEQTFYIAK
jgi:hypothetical protein